jgi:hypothetical protein
MRFDNRTSSDINDVVAVREITIVLATGQMAVATATLTAMLLTRTQRFDQFTVGNLAWTGASKTWEIPAALCFVIAIPIFWHIHAFIEARLARAGVGRTGLCLLLGACAPGLVLLGEVLVYPHARSLLWLGVAVPLDVLWIAISGAYALRVTGTDSSSAGVLLAAYLSPIMAGFSTLGATLAASRSFNTGTAFPAWLIGAMIAGGACVALLVFAPGWCKREALPGWSQLLAACQAGVPFLAAGLIPTPFSIGRQNPQPMHVGLAVLSLTLAVGAFAAADLIRCVRKKNHLLWGIASQPDTLTAAKLPISPVALLLCVWIIRAPFTPVPEISLDDWHFGETLLPYFGWHDFGELPFADVMPVRGFISVVNAAVAASLFGADAADIGQASAVIYLGFSALIFFPVYALAGAVAAAFSVIAADFSPLGQPDILIAAAFCVFCWFIVSGNNTSAIVAWSVISPIFFLLAPAQGLICAVATLPLVIATAIRANWRGRIVASIVLLAVAAVIAIALATHTGASIARGILRYITDNSAVLITGGGVPWFSWIELSGRRASFAPELIRSFALPIAGGLLVCATLLLPRPSALSRYDGWLTYIRSNAFVSMAIALSAALTVVVFLPRVLVRIDAFEGSRIGNLTLLMLGGIAPVVVARTRLRRNLLLLPIAITIVAGVKGMLVASDVFKSSLEPTAFLLPPLRTESDRLLTDGSALGLVHMGTTRTEPAHLQRLLLLKKSIDALLPPGEPYYDLSNHNADYVYLGRPVPAAWASPYYLDDDRAQVGVVEELRARGVKLLLLSAENITWDGGSNALRAYWLYRFALADYVAFRFNGFLLAVRRDLAGDEPFRSILAESTLAPNDVFEAAFAERDLKNIPATWGRSFGSLSHLLEPTKVSLELEAEGQGVAAPPDFDLLRLEFDCPSGLEAQATLRWEGLADGHAMSDVAQFTASSGTLLVPVGAYPSWMLAQRIEGVTLEADKCRVASASLYRRIRPPLRTKP